MSSSSLPAPRVLLGPGPSSVSPRVLEAMGRAPMGYLDPELFTLLEDLQRDLRAVFGTRNAATLALTGTGMAGMESCFANLVEPGDAVLIGVHGFFGQRMAEIAARYGAEVTVVEAEWGQPLNTDELAAAASRMPRLKVLACVHAETSTGVLQPLEALAEIARRQDAILVVDAVTSLGGLPVEIDGVGVDVCYSATQKCMGCPPGLSPISIGPRAMEAVAGRKSPVRSWYLDWRLLLDYWGGDHTYHHTVPVSLLMGFHESLRQIMEEGLTARCARHKAVSERLMDGLMELGLAPFACEGYRLPTLNAVTVPVGVDEGRIRSRLLREYGVEIGGGLGRLKGRIWRIGTMGESATFRNVELLLGALRRLLQEEM